MDVGYNRLTEEAALGIVRVERQRNKLTSLGLDRCSIGPTGAAEIAEYVSGSGVLKTLDLYGNNIRAKGAAAIAEAHQPPRQQFGRRGEGSDSRCGERAGRVQARDVSGL